MSATHATGPVVVASQRPVNDVNMVDRSRNGSAVPLVYQQLRGLKRKRDVQQLALGDDAEMESEGWAAMPNGHNLLVDADLQPEKQKVSNFVFLFVACWGARARACKQPVTVPCPIV